MIQSISHPLYTRKQNCREKKTQHSTRRVEFSRNQASDNVSHFMNYRYFIRITYDSSFLISLNKMIPVRPTFLFTSQQTYQWQFLNSYKEEIISSILLQYSANNTLLWTEFCLSTIYRNLLVWFTYLILFCVQL